MPLDIFGTEFLLAAYGVNDVPQRFLLELFFPAAQDFDTEKVAWDKVDRARRLAPFVSPNVAGRAMKHPGFKTLDFAPSYVKPKHVVDANRPLKRMAGERFLGAMSPGDRYLRVIMELMALQDEMITRREEWMGAQILLNGSMVVSGEDFPSMTVDFQRPPGHTVVLTGANRWGQTGISPMSSLRAWNRTVMLASGCNANIVIMDPLAQEFFIKDPEVREILNNRMNTPIGQERRIGNIQLAGVLSGSIGSEVNYLGNIGEFDIFIYSQTYTDSDGTVRQMIPDNTVILGSPLGFQGTRLYGAIRDARAGFRALPRFPKMWVEEDPSVTNIMTQSAPLPVSGWPEASFAATVN